MNDVLDSKEPPNFSLVQGGPLFQLLVRSRLTTATLDLLRRRIVCITMLAWLPLLILSLIDSKAWGTVGIPFLHDMAVQIRFLVGLPLLVAAELPVHRRLPTIVGQFIVRNIITEEKLPQFRGIIDSAMKLRNSVVMELLLLVLVFVVGHHSSSTLSGMKTVAARTGSWFVSADGAGAQLSPAGYWYSFVSRPLFQFMLLRWYFRLFIWARFLWQSSRLELKLIPTHPDRAAGLGFLGASGAAFTSLILAHGAIFAGLITNRIFYAGAKLTDFKLEFIGGVAFLLLLVLGPLLVYSPHLMRIKRTGMREYGILAGRYVSEFDCKWVGGGASDDESLLGSADIQSLADMANSFQVIREIGPFPFSKETAIMVIVMTLLPALPLVFTMFSIEELIMTLLGAVF